MKIIGWILLTLGMISVLLSLIGGVPMGGIFWIVLGAYLIHRANKKEEEKINKDKWMNQ